MGKRWVLFWLFLTASGPLSADPPLNILDRCLLAWKKLAYSLSPYGKILEEMEQKQKADGVPAGFFPYTPQEEPSSAEDPKEKKE